MGQASSRRSQPIFCSVYPLNKSFSKKLVIGLEYKNLEGEYQPVVRLCGSDYVGIPFSKEEWQNFKGTFSDVSDYFGDRKDDLFEQKIYGKSWSLRFSRNHKDKSIEVEEDRRPSVDGVVNKRYRSSIIMKKVTFEWLNDHVYKSIDNQFEYLSRIANFVDCIVKESVILIDEFAKCRFESQIENYSHDNVKEAILHGGDDCVDLLVRAVEKRAQGMQMKKMLCDELIADVFHQLATYHTETIADALNEKIVPKWRLL